MNVERLSDSKKLTELLAKFIHPAVAFEVHTSKESACSTPQIDSVELKHSDGSFLILGKGPYASSLQVAIPVTPKMIKKIKVSGELAGKSIFQIFDPLDYTKDFEDALTNVTKTEFEVPENA